MYINMTKRMLSHGLLSMPLFGISLFFQETFWPLFAQTYEIFTRFFVIIIQNI